MKRLMSKSEVVKLASYEYLSGGDILSVDNGSLTNFTTTMYATPLGLKFPDFQNNYENNPITKKQYGPNIKRTWDFIQPYDHAEWLMQDTK